jgi:hypothetical protein
MASHTKLLALAQYPGAPGIGFVVFVVWFFSAVSAMFGLWGKEGSFRDVRRWVKVLLTIAIWALPVVVILVVARLSD